MGKILTFGKQTLSLVGLSGLEPPTSRLSGVRSNQLSYKPVCYPSLKPTASKEYSVDKKVYLVSTDLRLAALSLPFGSLAAVSLERR
jgi:hypothetical protein